MTNHEDSPACRTADIRTAAESERVTLTRQAIAEHGNLIAHEMRRVSREIAHIQDVFELRTREATS